MLAEINAFNIIPFLLASFGFILIVLPQAFWESIYNLVNGGGVKSIIFSRYRFILRDLKVKKSRLMIGFLSLGVGLTLLKLYYT